MFHILSQVKATLLVGEGNFSFTVALLDSIQSLPKGCTVVSTSYESEDMCLAKYGKAECTKNIEFLLSNDVKVIHGVDATDISATIHTKFNAIIFQFPHTGRKSSITQNRNLLLKFFRSAKSVLHPGDSVVIVTLCAGQGGTPADSVVREKCNSWQHLILYSMKCKLLMLASILVMYPLEGEIGTIALSHQWQCLISCHLAKSCLVFREASQYLPDIFTLHTA